MQQKENPTITKKGHTSLKIALASMGSEHEDKSRL